ncbi:hypothetical protein CH275_17190 [Rhodococcus sp. 06-235-1A]|uniref:hypothetical protein n=1 Tax=Rhodococcus sp. 06-235-1A TaxID=2022508 RepID=UPI000B9A3501|nr:hypothetical protein [Rhodococcus sp. 06-235-1A]OZD02376.1 hypothetical protein CH275_17190 [Rhodococcus sp. 06-235-1A]
MKLSRGVLLLSTLVFVGALIWVGTTADDQVPAHFTGWGQIDRMESKSSFLLTTGGIGMLLIGFFASVAWWLPKVPARMVNMPSRRMHEYWTTAEHRPELNRKMAEDFDWIGSATALLLAWMVVVSGSTTGDSVNGWILVAPTASFLVAVLGYVAYLIKGNRYRIPSD